MVYELLYNTFHMMNKKQIDNLSKYCYDISKLIMGLGVIGNLISDKFSKHTLWIGLIGVVFFLIAGFVIDIMEVNNDDKR